MNGRTENIIRNNATLFRSWLWQRDISEEGAGRRVRLVQLSLKVMPQTSSPSTGEDRGEGALIFAPHSSSLPPGERELVSLHRSTNEIFCPIKANCNSKERRCTQN
jgi:hypothetical protein